MGTILSIALLTFCIVEAFRDLKRSLSFFLLALLFAPYIIIGSLYIRIELPLTPIYLAILLARRDLSAIRIPSIVWPLILLWGYTLALTLFSAIVGTAVSPSWFNVYAYIKPAFLILLFANMDFSESDLARLLRWFAASAIPLALLAAGQTFGVQAATDITMSAYMSPGRLVVERLVDELGFILRAVSVFETPSYAATYFLATLATAVYLLFELRGQQAAKRAFLMPLVALFASFLGGVVTLSATFVAGIGLILFMLFLRLEWRNKIRAVVISAAFGAIIIGYLMFLGKDKEYASIANNITYQVRRVVTLELFETRYAGNTGYLNKTMTAIGDSPLIGYGWMRKPGIFIGDSMYVVLLYQSGIIGLALFLFWLLQAYRMVAATRPLREILVFWLFVMLISGMGSPSFFIPRLNDWWWALCGIGASLSASSVLNDQRNLP